MALKVLGELKEMPTANKRGRKGEVTEFVETTLKKSPNKIFNIQANSSVANQLRKNYGVEARSVTTGVPQKDANGRPKVNKEGKPVYETHVAAVWRGEEKAQEIMKDYAERAAENAARKAAKAKAEEAQPASK